LSNAEGPDELIGMPKFVTTAAQRVLRFHYLRMPKLQIKCEKYKPVLTEDGFSCF